MNELLPALSQLFELQPLLLIFLGTSLGIIIGAIPGLTGAMLISLTLPLTFEMSYAHAMILLVSMYVGSISGGLITATLLRMPGTPASMVTTLDGYAMTKRGEPGRALGLGIMASFVGGLISWLFLLLLAKPMADLSTRLGPFELFSLVLMALTLIASVAGESLLKGTLSGLLGILVAMPGTNLATGELRLTFGFSELNGGFQLLPVLIGLFAVSQILKDVEEDDSSNKVMPPITAGLILKFRDWLKQGWNLIRSSILGTWIRILPGIGANIGSLVSYSAAKTVSKEPDQFGQGSEEGIVASEAANNATVGGALIPLISLGIPGSVIDAILLGALVMHGLQPGPLLFQNNPGGEIPVAWTIIATMLVSNCLMFALMLLSVRYLARLARAPKSYLTPVLLVFCVVGSFALSNRWFDVGVMLAFGVIGSLMERFSIPLAPFVIGFVLGPMAEKNLTTGLMIYEGSYLPLITRPLSLAFLILAFLMLLLPLWKSRSEKLASLRK